MALHVGQMGARGGAASACPLQGLPHGRLSMSVERLSRMKQSCGLALGRKLQASDKMQSLLVAHAQAASMEKPAPAESSAGKVEWFNKKKELWIEPEDADGLISLLKNNDSGKFVMVDFYAGWCSSCKTAYPALCKVADAPNFRESFVFAKADIQKPGVMAFVRSLGVKGIPTIIVFDAKGEKLASFSASFRKMNVVKANLVVIAANSTSQFIIDPNGYVIPKPE